MGSLGRLGSTSTFSSVPQQHFHDPIGRRLPAFDDLLNRFLPLQMGLCFLGDAASNDFIPSIPMTAPHLTYRQLVGCDCRTAWTNRLSPGAVRDAEEVRATHNRPQSARKRHRDHTRIRVVDSARKVRELQLTVGRGPQVLNVVLLGQRERLRYDDRSVDVPYGNAILCRDEKIIGKEGSRFPMDLLEKHVVVRGNHPGRADNFKLFF